MTNTDFRTAPGPRKLLITFSQSIISELDVIAQAEYRSRSDLVREAVRDLLHKNRISKAQLAQAHQPKQFIPPLTSSIIPPATA